jgi:glycosyltransferase involved in cell wall biosynthesis
MSVGGIPDVIKDCETGFIMNNNSPKCIAENVLRSLKYQDLDTLIQNAYKLVEDKFAFKVVLERYKTILEHFNKS